MMPENLDNDESIEIFSRLNKGKIVKIMDFGVFVEIAPGKEGLCHISQLDVKRTEKVSDVASLGDEIMVKVTGIDDSGRINLSRKEAILEMSKKD